MPTKKKSKITRKRIHKAAVRDSKLAWVMEAEQAAVAVATASQMIASLIRRVHKAERKGKRK